MSNITLRDISKALNVSVSTVSKALNDSYEISHETKKRIVDYAKAHNYHPNRLAKSLRQGRSQSIGVIVCSIDNAVVAEMLDGITTTCNLNGYHVIIMQSKESHEQENICIQFLKTHSVDGLLISPASRNGNLTHFKALQKSGLPIVLFDRLSTNIELNNVSADNFDGGYKATSHLIKNGYDKIAHIAFHSEFNITIERLKGYKQALIDNHIACKEEYIKLCQYKTAEEMDQKISQALIDLMHLPDPPNAIFTAADRISTRSIDLIKKLGYSIPDDLALVGFTNTELADILNPALTTIHQPAFEIGQKAAHLLLSLVEKELIDAEIKTVTLPVSLQVRRSSAPLSNLI